MADETGLVEQMYADFSQGNVGAVLQVLDEQVEWSEAESNPWWAGQPAVGAEQVVEQVFARIPQDFDGFTIHVERMVGLGETVLVQGRYTGAGKATGRRLDAQMAHVWDVRGGRVVRFQQYVDTAHLREVLGV